MRVLSVLTLALLTTLIQARMPNVCACVGMCVHMGGAVGSGVLQVIAHTQPRQRAPPPRARGTCTRWLRDKHFGGVTRVLALAVCKQSFHGGHIFALLLIVHHVRLLAFTHFLTRGALVQTDS